jgi:uncharacterized protein YkwD
MLMPPEPKPKAVLDVFKKPAVPPAPPSPPQPPAPDVGPSEDAGAEVIRLVNLARAAAGVAPLISHPALVKAAEGHARDQARHDTLTHYGIDGLHTWADRCLAAGYPGASLDTIRENGASGQTTPEQVVWDWHQSPGHRAAMLDPRMRHAGAAKAHHPGGVDYWTLDLGCIVEATPTARVVPSQEPETFVPAARVQAALVPYQLYRAAPSCAGGACVVPTRSRGFFRGR